MYPIQILITEKKNTLAKQECGRFVLLNVLQKKYFNFKIIFNFIKGGLYLFFVKLVQV